MDGAGETHSAPSPAPAAAYPSLDSDFTPVGSPEDHTLSPAEEEEEEVHGPPSDEDHEHHDHHGEDHEHDVDHDEDPDRGQDESPGASVQTEDLKEKIIKQVEYYFSDENLPTDKYMISLIKKNKEGFVPIKLIASFRKMKKLTRDLPFIIATLRESCFLVVSTDGKKVKRLHPFPFAEAKDPKLCTVLVENLPEDHSVENIRRIFGGVGKIRNISVRDPHALEESRKRNKAEILISSKLHALVEYESVEAAEKAVAALNDEQDWRNGMHVKLLKRTVKHGQRRQAWRDPDSEKNGASHASNRSGDEEHHNLSEHHDDTPDEEDGEHTHAHKEKDGNGGRNRGRPRRNRYRNGLGHGTTSSAHAVEPSKPPPGPKMPDGTRGFTMGRGRPLGA